MAGKPQTVHGVRHVTNSRTMVALVLSGVTLISMLGSKQVMASPNESGDENIPFVLEAQESKGLLALETMPKTLQHPVVQLVSNDSMASTVVNNCEAFKAVTSGVAHEVPTMIDGKQSISLSTIDASDKLAKMDSKSTKGPSNEGVLKADIDNSNSTEGTDDEVVDIYYAMAKGKPQTTSEPLLKCYNEDSNYSATPIQLTAGSRDAFERLVMGEAGDEGYEGATLVAQALRDTMLMTGNFDTMSIKRQFGYTGKVSRLPNDDVRRACSFVLDNGGSAVKHRIIYFYAPKYTHGGVSSFHESQIFVIEWKGHRVFDRR